MARSELARPCSCSGMLYHSTWGRQPAPFASFNLGDHVGDDPLAVAENRRLLSLALPNPPHWLTQTHSTQVNIITTPTANAVLPADASVTQIPEAVCVVMTADCLPLLLTDQQGTVVAAVHAGWRGYVMALSNAQWQRWLSLRQHYWRG